jgi:hypothetical protein
MPTCQKIKKKHRQICVGDLEDFGTINSRDIEAPKSGGVDFSEKFTKKIDSFMLIETVRGESLFDEVGTEQDVTHKIYVPFVSGLTFEDWLDVETQRFDIIDVEDLDNRHEFQLCRCTNRGLAAKAATDA